MKKGFTLVELLAVIVILSIIAIITIPMIKGVIDKVKMKSLEDSVYGLKSAAELYYSSNEKVETTEFICSDNGCISNTGKKLDYKGKVEGRVKLFSDGKVSICLTSDNYASSILASDKKTTTKMGGCDEETYEISEVIAIEKYNEIKSDLDSVNNDFLLIKNELYNQKFISNVDNQANTIKTEISNYGLGINKLTDSLYNKTIISSKENTFEQIANEIDNLDLETPKNDLDEIKIALKNKGIINNAEASKTDVITQIENVEFGKNEEQLKSELYNSLKYSGLVTSNMTYSEMLSALEKTYPAYKYFIENNSFKNGTSFSSVQYTETGTNSSISTSGNLISATAYSTKSTAYHAGGYIILNNSTFKGSGQKLKVKNTYSDSGAFVSSASTAYLQYVNKSTGAVTNICSLRSSFEQYYTMPNDGGEYYLRFQLRSANYTGDSAGSTTYYYKLNTIQLVNQ